MMGAGMGVICKIVLPKLRGTRGGRARRGAVRPGRGE